MPTLPLKALKKYQVPFSEAARQKNKTAFPKESRF
ncbi:spb1 gene forserine protease (AJ428902) related protein [Bdellovibrio bacteriovorus HD100]|uniref:Spb1 gene forserine protease (AJ428902) related protein n=1 Tax=Bdellovibrio bacteriovorus (strain ATCC 15356 / DSM 50701 / NCIMB 9529 / HD100) TaxID=264462 RepID=Q6MKV9_BDEBA|nr:spb1 gene forserine protease (AJ428902) related protein [Bdellovibrio bacteriovorus HD100]